MSVINNKSESVIQYLEFKQAPYLGRIYKTKLTLGNLHQYKRKLIDNHELSELRTIKAVLEGQVESGKFFSPNQTFYSTLSAGIFAFFLAMFTVTNGLMNGFLGFLSGPYLESKANEEKEKALEGIMNSYPSVFEEIIKVGMYVGWFILLIVSIVGLSMIITTRRYKVSAYYYSIIEQCILEKEKEITENTIVSE
jgi:hypothetical protein